MTVLADTKKAVEASNFEEAGKLIGGEIKLNITADEMQKVLGSKLKDKIEDADLNSVDRVFDDVKEFVKDL